MQQSIFAKYEGLVSRISSPLKDFGFVQGKTDEFLRKRERMFQRLAICLRELPTGAEAFVEVSPGFNFPEVEAMAASLQGKTQRAGFLTCSMNLGLLTEKASYLEWPLSDTHSLEHSSQSIIQVVVKYADPFWQQFLSIEDLIEGFEKGDRRLCRGSEWPWRQVAAYCLTGQTSRAVEVLHQRQAKAPVSARAGIQQAIKKIEQLTT